MLLKHPPTVNAKLRGWSGQFQLFSDVLNVTEILRHCPILPPYKKFNHTKYILYNKYGFLIV